MNAMMNNILPLILLISLFGFLLSLLINRKNESLQAVVALGTTLIQNVIAIPFTIYWALSGKGAIHSDHWVFYRSSDIEFAIELYFDNVTAVFLMVGNALTFLITIYSLYYLHREDGYKRFFNTILFFYLGYNIIIFSGNLLTFFAGWEVLGISSFLLIGFYRERYLPVRNAFKVYSIYRVGDIAILLAMWMSHKLWHHNFTFSEFNMTSLTNVQIVDHSGTSLFISLMILIAAGIKSAQYPFSSWLPRAMEGPTPSSAIFYSSLSVHIGVFLLLRTYPFWEEQEMFRWIVGIVGVVSSIVSTFVGNVQSTVKSQIAYSSIAQIGLIFLEISLGFETLALIHFAGNALLRSYQLLVSPSAVTYLIREQFYTTIPAIKKRTGFWRKVFNSIYILSVKEWNMDTYQFRYLWNPFKKIGKLFDFLSIKITIFLVVPVYILCWVLLLNGNIEGAILPMFQVGFATTALIIVLRSFVERRNPFFSFALSAFSHLWIVMAIFSTDSYYLSHAFTYLSGVILSFGTGWILLMILRARVGAIDINDFYGHAYQHKWLAFCFLLTCLGMAGFPITPTFLGEDMIFTHLDKSQIWLVILIVITLIFCGLSIMRIYSRLFLGPPMNADHAVANRSS